MSSTGPLKIHIGPLLLWSFSIALLHLGGIYLGGMFAFLRFIVLLFPLFSIVYMAVVYSGLRLNQQFSTEHPQKFETVEYQFILGNESRLPSYPLQLSFAVGGHTLEHLHSRCSIEAHSQFTFMHTVTCPYRGVYTVGSSEIRLVDILGILSLYLPVWYRTFYVYPRILPLTAALLQVSSAARAAHIPEGAVADLTLVRSITEFRTGAEMRHIAWKKFAQHGIPMIREYDSSSSQGLNIVIDTRGSRKPGSADQYTADTEIEDVSLESALSLAGRCVELGIPTMLHADGMPSVGIYSQRDLDTVRERSIGLFFHSVRSPLEMPDYQAGAVILISHILDRETLYALEHRRTGGADIRLIANICKIEYAHAKALTELRRREGWENRMAIVRRSEDLDSEISQW
ncbi:MAG: DUF58 domain-containing protein [Spirochaeta sp.]